MRTLFSAPHRNLNPMTNSSPHHATADTPVRKTSLTGEPMEERAQRQVPAVSGRTDSHDPMTDSDSVHEEQTEPERAAGIFLKLLAIVGLIGLLALAAWLSVQIIRYTPTAVDSLSGVSFSSIFSPGTRGEGEIRFALESLSYQSGRPFTLAWENGAEIVSRDYTFSYSCAPGVSFRVLRGTEVIDVACDEPFEFSSMANQLVVVPTSESNRYLDTTITLARANDPDTATRTTLTVVNAQLNDSPDLLVQNGMRDVERPGPGVSEPEDLTEEIAVPERPSTPTPDVSAPSVTAPTPAPTPTPQPTTPRQPVYVPNPAAQSNPAGRPDLAVRIVESGIVTTLGGEERFVTLSPIPSDQRAAVRFTVENLGNRTSSDAWYFVATLPIEGNTEYTYRSPRQAALGPSDRIEFTLKFDDITTSAAANIRIVIEGETDDRVPQNNTAQTRLQVSER